MELVHAGVMAFAAAVGVAFLALVAGKTAELMWIVVTALGRAVFWLTIGWWVDRIKAAIL
jgi:hypothetical protein